MLLGSQANVLISCLVPLKWIPFNKVRAGRIDFVYICLSLSDRFNDASFFNSFKLSGSYTGNLLMATYSKGKAEERHAEAGRVFGCAAQSFGENVSEAEVHQQTRQEEAGHETRPERFSGRSYMS